MLVEECLDSSQPQTHGAPRQSSKIRDAADEGVEGSACRTVAHNSASELFERAILSDGLFDPLNLGLDLLPEYSVDLFREPGLPRRGAYLLQEVENSHPEAS